MKRDIPRKVMSYVFCRFMSLLISKHFGNIYKIKARFAQHLY